MDTPSIVASHPALADAEARLRKGPALAAHRPAEENAMKVQFPGSDREAAESARIRRAMLPRWCVCNA
jgi:hypothetical protein